jgi:protoheme IX farnesyltransferase
MMLLTVGPVLGITGRLHLSGTAAVIIFLMGSVMLWFAIQIYKKRENVSARKLMRASVSYITLMQIVYVADKYI